MDTVFTAATQSADISPAVAAFLVILYGGIFIVAIWIYSRIVAKSGYPWPWVFIMFVPVANIVFLCIFAFKPWPIEQQLAATRYALQEATGSPYPAVPQGAYFGGQPGGKPGGFGGGWDGGQGGAPLGQNAQFGAPGPQFGAPGPQFGPPLPQHDPRFGPPSGGPGTEPPSGNPYGPKY